MINGFCSIDSEEPDKVYDYSGVLFPEGSLSSDQTLLFNHDQIEKIYYMAEKWSLVTIQEEAKNCHLYEKLGYQRTGEMKHIKNGMDIVFLEKII